MKKVVDIGIEMSDEDFEFFRRETIGDEKRVLKAIAKLTVIECARIGKKRKIRPRFILYQDGQEIPKLYDEMDSKVGEKTRKSINLYAVRKIRNGNGTLNETLKQIDKDFEEWKVKNEKR